MKKNYSSIYGLVIYIIIICVLFQLNISALIQPLPALAVLIGTTILTVSNVSKNFTLVKWLYLIKKNALISGLLASLFLALSTAAEGITQMASATMPGLYGSFIFLVLSYILNTQYFEKENDTDISNVSSFSNLQWNTEAVAHPVFLSHGFSPRECHVALKIIQGSSNKEIGEILFITESTVKKHVQNIYKKCEVNDRQSFINLYLSWI